MVPRRCRHPRTRRRLVPNAGPKPPPMPRYPGRPVAVATRLTTRHQCRRRRCRCSTPLRPARSGRPYLDDRRRSRNPWPPAPPSRCQPERQSRGLLVGLGSAVGVRCAGSSSPVGCAPCSRRLGARSLPSALVRPVCRFVAARSSRRPRVLAGGRLGVPLAAWPWRGRGHRLAPLSRPRHRHLGVPAWSPHGPVPAPESWDTATQLTVSRCEVGR